MEQAMIRCVLANNQARAQHLSLLSVYVMNLSVRGKRMTEGAFGDQDML
jgi:hypothetical protein